MAGQRKISGRIPSIEHAYPADWIAMANGCPNRNTCSVAAYGFAEADLHNLWPALQNINSGRSDLRFGEIPGEGARRFTDYCPDFERTQGADAVLEPRDDMTGDLARSIPYMSVTYGLPLRGPNGAVASTAADGLLQGLLVARDCGNSSTERLLGRGATGSCAVGSERFADLLGLAATILQGAANFASRVRSSNWCRHENSRSLESRP